MEQIIKDLRQYQLQLIADMNDKSKSIEHLLLEKSEKEMLDGVVVQTICNDLDKLVEAYRRTGKEIEKFQKQLNLKELE